MPGALRASAKNGGGLALLLLAALSGCRAQATSPGSAHDLAVVDLSMPPDLAHNDDFATVELEDLSMVSDLACPRGPSEICGNGCDDDGNGYSDGDDPACTPQVVATPYSGASEMDRLILAPGTVTATRFVDGNVINGGAHALINGALAPGLAWVAYDAASERIDIITLPPPGTHAAGAVTNPSVSFSTRDVCAFAGQLVVVDASGSLHLMSKNGAPTSTIALGGTLLPTSCASDGRNLYVAVHDYSTPTAASYFLTYDSTFTLAAPRPLPPAITARGYDRCLDFAWTSRGFYGLFVASGGAIKDYTLNATQITPFAFDGGVGPPIDAGTLHGLGEFNP